MGQAHLGSQRQQERSRYHGIESLILKIRRRYDIIVIKKDPPHPAKDLSFSLSVIGLGVVVEIFDIVIFLLGDGKHGPVLKAVRI